MTTQYQDVFCSLTMPDLSRYCRFIPATLPSLPLNQKHQLPSVPAVYFALGEGNEVLYIGRSISLSTRWSTHHRLPELRNLGNVRLAWIELESEEFLEEVEKVLISHFSPKLNGLREMTDPNRFAISMRVSKEEYETIRQVALANKRKMSDFCRIAAMEAAQQYLDAHPEEARAKRKGKTVA